MDEGEERLIAKLQIEFAKRGPGAEGATWDIGLLYVTSKNLWFVNRKKERTQIAFSDISNVGEVGAREGDVTTEFTEVLNATHTMAIAFAEEGEGRAIDVAAASSVLAALRSQLIARSSVQEKAEEATVNVDASKKMLYRKISVFLNIDLPIIADPQMLKYFLNMEQQDLVNILVERSQMVK